MVPPDSHRISRVPRYSGVCYASYGFVYWSITIFGAIFQKDEQVGVEKEILKLKYWQPYKDELDGLHQNIEELPFAELYKISRRGSLSAK